MPHARQTKSVHGYQMQAICTLKSPQWRQTLVLEALAEMKTLCETTGGTISLTADIKAGVKDADVIYTDVWVSMGEEDQMDERIRLLKPYQVNKELMDRTGNPDAIFLHCLPSFHDLKTKIGKEIHDRYGLNEMEVTDEVFESAQSRVFEEAENRMHTIKAVMVATLGER